MSVAWFYSDPDLAICSVCGDDDGDGVRVRLCQYCDERNEHYLCSNCNRWRNTCRSKEEDYRED